MIRTTPLIRLTKKPKYIIFAVTIANIKKAFVRNKSKRLLFKASCLNVRQVAVTCRRGTSVVRNLKFLTLFSEFLIIKLINYYHYTYSSSGYR